MAIDIGNELWSCEDLQFTPEMRCEVLTVLAETYSEWVEEGCFYEWDLTCDDPHDALVPAEQPVVTTVRDFFDEPTGEIEDEEPWLPVCQYSYFAEWLVDYLEECWCKGDDDELCPCVIWTTLQRVREWVEGMSIRDLLDWKRAQLVTRSSED